LDDCTNASGVSLLKAAGDSGAAAMNVIFIARAISPARGTE
jgi:hypothetical protein